MARNISDTTIAPASTYNASGFSFNTGATRIVAPDNRGDVSLVNDVIPRLGKTIGNVMNNLNQQAFLQGQVDQATDAMGMGNAVDSAAALIDEASWLTKEAYSQGVHYQQFTDKTLDTQQQILNQARKSAENDEPIEVFSQKVKPFLATLNRTANDMGLTGDARAEASRQILAFTAVTQKAYQKAREQVTEERYVDASNKVASAGLQLLGQTTDADDSAAILSGVVSQLLNVENSFDPIKGADNTGKKVLSVINGLLANTNPMDDGDLAKMAGYNKYLLSSEASSIPTEHRAAMLKAIASKQEEFTAANDLSFDNAVRGLETTYAHAGAIDTSTLQSTAVAVQRAAVLGQLKPAQASTILDRLHTLSLKADKELGQKQLTMSSNADQRRAYKISDADQTKELSSAITQMTAAQGRPEAAGQVLVATGLKLQNYNAVESGYAQIVGNYTAALTRSLDEFNKAPDAIAQRNFDVDRSMYSDALMRNDDLSLALQYKAWQSQLGPNGAAAMEQLMADPQVHTIEDVIARYAMVNTQQEQLRQSGNMGNVQFSGDALGSGMFGQLFGLSNTAGAELWKNASSEVRDIHARNLQMVYNQNKASLISKYNIKSDDGGASALKAMRAEGLVTRTPYGTAIMSEQTKKMIGQGVNPSADYINRMDTAIRQSTLNAVGTGSGATLENMLVEYHPSHATVKVFSDNLISDDTLITVRSIPMSEIRSMANREDTSANSNRRPVDVMPAYLRNGQSKNTTVIQDNGVFGSNQVKADALTQIAADEGYFTTPTQVDKDDPRTLLVGHSVRIDLYAKMFGEKQAQDFVLAARDPSSEQYGKLYDAFINEHFKGFPSTMKRAGVNPQGLLGTTKATKVLASTYYHGPSSANVLADAMRAVQEGGDFRKAVESVKATPAYREAGAARQRDMIAALESLR